MNSSELSSPVENPPSHSHSRPAPPLEPARKAFPLVTVLVGVLVIGGLVFGLLQRRQQKTALREEMRSLSVPTVNVILASPGKAAAGLLLPAEVKPLVEAPIYSRANGYLKRWLVDMGQSVKAGEVLAEIDTPDLTQELDQSRAQLRQAQAALALAKTTATRWEELLKTSSVSEQEGAEKQADLAYKSATVEAAQANVRRLEQVQSFSLVTAPFEGVITQRKADVGELVHADNGRELFRLAQTRTLRVHVHVPQTAVRGVAPGQVAQLLIPELSTQPVPAKVVRTSGSLLPETRTLLVELEVENAKGTILAGSYAQVRLPVADGDLAIAIPSSCVLLRPDGLQVGVVHEGGKVEMRHVSVGRDFGLTMEIIDGLKPGEQVISNPSDSLVNDLVVRVAAPEKKSETK